MAGFGLRAASLLLIALIAPTAAWGQVKGDLNEDGAVDVGDAVLLSQIVSGKLAPSVLSDEALADVGPVVSGVGGNGTLGVEDGVVMMRALAGFDVDGDGLDTAGENAIGTSPFLADTDGDGIPDLTDPEPLVPEVPLVPDSLRVVDGPSSVTLTWSAPQAAVDSYIVHRYGTDGEYSYFTVDGAATSFVDTTVTGGTVYFYWIQAVDADGDESEFVNCDITDPDNSTLWLTGAIGPTANPYFETTLNGSDVDLNWEQSSDPNVVGYRIYRSTTAVPLGSTAGLALEYTANGIGTTTHTVSGLASGAHYFRITAFTPSTESLLESAKQVVVVVP